MTTIRALVGGDHDRVQNDTRDPSPVSERKRPPSKPRPELRSYEELDGGVGREINFRPPRYPSSELGPVGARVVVEHDGVEVVCELHDVSQNGVAFEWGAESALQIGDTISNAV